MATISATDAKNRIGELWAMAENEPVTIERNGVPRFELIPTDKYVAVRKEEYDLLKKIKRVPQFGFAKELLAGLDVDTLLAVDVSNQFTGSLF